MKRLSKGRLIITILFGVFVGLSAYTFNFAHGISYFKKDPEACANCHIMQSQLDSWRKSSHHTTALCVDCHLPHEFLAKYIAKTDNGYRHSKGFTFQDFHEPIQIGKRNSEILQKNCMRCHSAIVEELAASFHTGEPGVSCVHCHRDVGHGEYVGLGGADE